MLNRTMPLAPGERVTAGIEVWLHEDGNEGVIEKVEAEHSGLSWFVIDS